MATYKINKPFYFFILLSLSGFGYANSNHDIYMMTLSILSYAKMPSENLDLCIVDNQDLANNFQQRVQQQDLKYKIQTISSKDLPLTSCSAVFFSKAQPNVEQKLIRELHNKSVLSFSSNNDQCEIGSAFCLYKSKNGNTLFKVNLDSLAKSRVHIDPRVLLLAQNME